MNRFAVLVVAAILAALVLASAVTVSRLDRLGPTTPDPVGLVDEGTAP